MATLDLTGRCINQRKLFMMDPIEYQFVKQNITKSNHSKKVTFRKSGSIYCH